MMRLRRLCVGRMFAVVACVMVAATACAQVGASAATSAPVAVGADGKPLAFEVATIRDSKGGTGFPYATTPDGYRMTNVTLAIAALQAYVPTNGAMMYGSNTMRGFPEWAMRERFDIDARVAEGDLVAWRKPELQPVMLRAMLAQLLTDRCKLVVDRDVKEVSVFRLMVAKGGVKIKESTPGEVYPAGQTLPGGGVMSYDGSKNFHLYGATMTMLTVLLSNLSGRPVQDMTGLTGKYDFTMPRPTMGLSPVASADGAAPVDAGPSIFEVVGGLGLKLEPAKGMVETLVVDHVERPSEN